MCIAYFFGIALEIRPFLEDYGVFPTHLQIRLERIGALSNKKWLVLVGAHRRVEEPPTAKSRTPVPLEVVVKLPLFVGGKFIFA